VSDRVQLECDDWQIIGTREEDGVPATVWLTRGDREPEIAAMLTPNEATVIGTYLLRAAAFAAGEEGGEV